MAWYQEYDVVYLDLGQNHTKHYCDYKGTTSRHKNLKIATTISDPMPDAFIDL